MKGAQESLTLIAKRYGYMCLTYVPYQVALHDLLCGALLYPRVLEQVVHRVGAVVGPRLQARVDERPHGRRASRKGGGVVAAGLVLVFGLGGGRGQGGHGALSFVVRVCVLHASAWRD